MNGWDELRRQALEKHELASKRTGGDLSASALLAAAAAITGISCHARPSGDSLLAGAEAVLDPESKAIWFNQDVDEALMRFFQAHEYAHWWIDGGQANCTPAHLDPEASEISSRFGIQRVEGYGPKELRERQANVYGREFLLPTTTLWRWYIEENLSADEIIVRVGLPAGMVLHQLARAVLIPDAGGDPVRSSASRRAVPPLDPSQKRAAEVPHGPFLVNAGPGTGKTRTLIGRIDYLLRDCGVAPTSIIALTFSNKAAEEMRERVATVAPAAAPYLWLGTFHAFGLELLRKYGDQVDLPSDPQVLDPMDALFLLERELPRLDLKHYQNLYEPAIALRDILNAISRAKDELVDPVRYAQLATAMAGSATNEDQLEKADRAAEVAAVYAHYQRLLEKEKALDFGDLIARSVRLLQNNPNVRDQVRVMYSHILVDEYQDVNRASGVLLREIAGDGSGLWVVGDVRQSIYRFRGAAPSNIRRFADDFPGAGRDSLEVNYRSQPVIVDTVAALAPEMRATRAERFTPWRPNRPQNGGSVVLEIAEDGTAEAEGIAAAMLRRHEADGIAFRDQAVLCRSHTSLARIAGILEQKSVPILYLGDLFERPEIRDLLALLSLQSERNGRGLVRVARFPEYDIALADVQTLLEIAREADVSFPKALSLGHKSTEISPHGKEGFRRISSHLEGISFVTSAWGMLARYLFERSNFLRPHLEDGSVSGQQRRAAIFQFLRFAHEQRQRTISKGEDPKRSFLRLIRRLEQFGEEKQLRDIPEWTEHIDAVRLLTVHGSKGLEFSAAYVPTLGRGYFPANRQWQPCPPPDGMLMDSTDDDHDEEEECLFFVAISRARDYLCLSRAQRYGQRTSNPSSILDAIRPSLTTADEGAISWARKSEPSVARPMHLPPPEQPVFSVEELELYIRCPRRYYYERRLGLAGTRDDSAYLQFHRCVYEVLRQIAEEGAAGGAVDLDHAEQLLANVWRDHGPLDHPYEPIYRQYAEEMVARAVSRIPVGLAVERPNWEIQLTHGLVTLQPDNIELRESGVTAFQHLRTGRISKSEHEKDIYALYQLGAEQGTSGTRHQVEAVSLSTDTAEVVRLTAQMKRTRVGHFDAAMAGILSEDFQPKPSERECPRCPHYFICPKAEDT